MCGSQACKYFTIGKITGGLHVASLECIIAKARARDKKGPIYTISALAGRNGREMKSATPTPAAEISLIVGPMAIGALAVHAHASVRDCRPNITRRSLAELVETLPHEVQVQALRC